MTTDHLTRVRDALETAGIEVNEVRTLPNGTGRQLRCAGGQIVTVYDSGAVVPGGRDAPAVKALLANVPGPAKKREQVRPRATSPTVPPQLSLVRQPVPAESPQGPRRYWTDEPWDGTTLPWDPLR